MKFSAYLNAIKTSTFKKILLLQLAIYLFLLLLGVFSFRLITNEDPSAWILLTCFFVSIVLAALITAYKVADPLLRLKEMLTQTLSKKPLVLSEENLLEEDSGAYSEIEVLFNKLNKKLIKRKVQIQKVRNEIQAVVENLNEGVVNIMPDGKVLFFNSQFAAQFLDSTSIHQQEILFSDVIRDQFIYDIFDACVLEKSHKKGIVKLKTIIDKLPRFFNVSFSPIFTLEGKEIQSIVAVFLDVTDLKLTEQIRTDFVMNASHELKTPLTILKGYVATLKGDLKQQRFDAIDNYVDVCEKNINRLNDLVSDLLSLAKLENNPELKIEKFHPLMLTETLVTDFDSVLKQKNQKIHILGGVNELAADPAKVDVVLRNLVSNAIKYSAENRTIKIIWSDENPNYIELKVVDEGAGIAPEHLPRLFERFYRVDAGRSRDMGGTGLGLAIVKHIMETHRGSVSVTSEVGRGSEFICRFPKVKDALS